MDRSTTINATGPGCSLSPKPVSKVFQHSLTLSNYLPPDDHHFHHHLNPVDDSEISIFDAQKYFNEPVSTVNVIISQPRLSCGSPLDGYGRKYRTGSFNATPTASSEASWNSRTGLLTNPPGAIAVSVRNATTSDDDEKKRAAGCGTKWLFWRKFKCPCSGEKCVQVEENLSEPRKQTLNSIEICSEKSNGVVNTQRISASCRENGGQRVLAGSSGSGRSYNGCGGGGGGTTGFTFPILNQTSPIKVVRLHAPPPPPLEDPPRESLEIFQPSDSTDQILMPRQSFKFAASPKSRKTTAADDDADDDDAASDGSSDLFEIESFSTQTTSYPMYHRRDSLDEARLSATNIGGLYCGRTAAAAAECYEPSEASIDWSVTTAEGFDRGSAVTNFSVTTTTTTASEENDQSRQNKSNVDGGHGRSKRGNGGGVLSLSCRSEKAVCVGPNPVKCVSAESASTAKHHMNYCRSSKLPPLPRSHSIRLSPPFQT